MKCHDFGIEGEFHQGARILFVGIAPGFNEMVDGVPFVGQSGRLLDSVFRGAGFTREDANYTNICCWRPEDDKPTPEDIEACLPRLRAEIAATQPTLIIPLGALPAEVLTGAPAAAHGKNGKFSIAKLRGAPLWYDDVIGSGHSCRIMATWHPAAFLRDGGANIIMDICRDMQKLMPAPKGVDLLSWSEVRNTWSYTIVDDAAKVLFMWDQLNPAWPVAIDIETGNPEAADDMTMDVYRERIICFSIAQCNPNTMETNSWVITPAAYDEFIDYFNKYGADFRWLTHYGFFDKQGLRRHFGIDLEIAEDTLCASYALDERQGVHSLKTLAREYVGAGWWEAPVHKAIAEYKRKAKLLALACDPAVFDLLTNDEMCDPACELAKREKPKKGESFLVGGLATRFDDVSFHRSRRTMDDEQLAWYNNRLEAIDATGWDVVPLSIMYPYNAEDSARTAQLLVVLTGMMEEDGVIDLYRNIMIPDMNVNADICFRGMHVDVDKLDELTLRWGPLWQQLQAELTAETVERGYENEDGTPINLASPRQKAKWIYDVLQIIPPVSKKLITATGQRSTNIKILDQVKDQDEWLQKYIGWTHLDHNIGSYVLPMGGFLRDDGRIHAQWKPHAARTGRDSFADPPLHQIPKHVEADEEFARYVGGTGHELRELFDAHGRRDLGENEGDYVFVEADYERGEYYIAAYISGDDALLSICRASDLHRATASRILYHIPEEDVTDKQRRDAKYVNFGMMFGMQADSLAKEHLHCPIWEAETLIQAWWAGYPDLKKWTSDRRREALTTGEIVVPYTGRKRRFRLILGEDSFKELNQAINMPIKGTLGDYQKDSRIKLNTALRPLRSHMIVTVHDMIAFEVHKAFLRPALVLIREVMEEPKFGLPGIPVDIKIGPDWGHTQKPTEEYIDAIAA